MRLAEPSVRQGVFRIEFGRACEQRASLPILRARTARQFRASLHDHVGRGGARGLRRAAPRLLQPRYPARQRARDLPSDLILERKHVLDLAIVSLRPEQMMIRPLSKLRGDADALACPPHAPLD